MAWYPDLSPHEELGGALLMVGWLERGQPFSQGEVSEAFFEKLCELP
jgi:hypothetical protein